MNRLLTLLAISGGAFLFSGCSQEDILPDKSEKKDHPITFRAGVASRVNPDFNFLTTPGSFYVTGYIDSHKADADGKIPDPYFANEQFSPKGDNTFTGINSYSWPGESPIEFFAYAPSLPEIQEAAYTQFDPNASNYATLKANYERQIQFFNLCDKNAALDPIAGSTTFDGVQLYNGFKLGRFYVATDISKQIDFITAHVSASAPADEEAKKNFSVELNFKHQLANVELRAFSGNPSYNIEIAGVRLGRPYTGNAIFNFCDAYGNVDYAEGGQWGISKNPQRLPVEYIYQDGDSIYRMGTYVEGGLRLTPHFDKATAGSIMGKGGNAMVLPTKNGKWAGLGNRYISSKYLNADNSPIDPSKAPDPWSPDAEFGDMYMSVLVRVSVKTENGSGTQVYPYRNNNTMNVVYLKKEKGSNRITGRTAKGGEVGANEEVAEFGWACVPVSVDWKKGTRYIYTLDFTEGVGIQDPDDDDPGAQIIGSGITFSTSVAGWGTGSGDGDLPIIDK